MTQAVNPLLNAIIETNHQALELAADADARRLKGIKLSLLGLPVVVKDSIATERQDDRDMQTTAGSFALEGSYPAGDATVVKRLKEAGAIILAKANVTQWSCWRTRKFVCGYSCVPRRRVSDAHRPRGGVSYCPYIPRGQPDASSQGSAIAATLALCTFALGGETEGSVIGSADFNGCVGLKPTPGLVSRRALLYFG